MIQGRVYRKEGAGIRGRGNGEGKTGMGEMGETEMGRGATGRGRWRRAGKGQEWGGEGEEGRVDEKE